LMIEMSLLVYCRECF